MNIMLNIKKKYNYKATSAYGRVFLMNRGVLCGNAKKEFNGLQYLKQKKGTLQTQR